MNHNMKRFASFIFLNNWKRLGAYYIIKSGVLNNELRVVIYFAG